MTSQKHFADFVPNDIADLLKKAGMPIYKQQIEDLSSAEGSYSWYYRVKYAEAFDWLMTKGIYISILPIFEGMGFDIIRCNAILAVHGDGFRHGLELQKQHFDRWHKAADAAITKASELLTEQISV